MRSTLLATGAAWLAVWAAGCGQQWRFAPGEFPASRATRPVAVAAMPAAAGGEDRAPAPTPPEPRASAVGPRYSAEADRGVVAAGGDSVASVTGAAGGDSAYSVAGAAFVEDSSLIDRLIGPPPLPAEEECPFVDPSPARRLRHWFCDTVGNGLQDQANYFSWPTFRDLAIGMGGMAAVANTSADQHFRNWYQDDVRSVGTDDFASFWKAFGEGSIFIPGMVAVSLVGQALGERPLFHAAGRFGDRTSRAYLVGFPPMLFCQVLIGASRPGERDDASYWRPFDDDNGVSGHAFMGAVPFITAAQMSDGPWLKGGFYALSTLTAWSRVNDDQHYLSQAVLGWWMGYLACRAVEGTEAEDGRLTVSPLIAPEMTGVLVSWRR